MPIFLRIEKGAISDMLMAFSSSYRIIGPRLRSDVIILGEITYADLPLHIKDIQKPGYFRLSSEGSDYLFSFSIGPDSFKRFLFPPEKELFTWQYSEKYFNYFESQKEEKPLLLFGLRACDMEALSLYDRIFLEDEYYRKGRDNSLIISINCLFPNENCFCTSLSTGPEVKKADLIITELEDCLLLEVQNTRTLDFLKEIKTERADYPDIKSKDQMVKRCRELLKKQVDMKNLSFLLKRLEDPIWKEIAEIDLECGNCTQVCPTCFCNSTFDKLRLGDISKKAYQGSRIRVWDSCFSRNFSRVHGGNFRPSRRARYRHWFMHKFYYMEEQFGIKGCVGCGRCITWCPAGIDITEVLRRLIK